MSKTSSPETGATVAGRVTFIVPTKDSARTLDACLSSIRAQRADDVELIVVDNHSADQTQRIARTHAHKLIVAGPERSAQRNIGARAATGEHLVFIDSDMVVAADVAAEVRAMFADQHDLSALVLPEQAFGAGFWARCRVLEKELYLGRPDAEAARAYRRNAFLDAGGYDPGLHACEDWDLPDRLIAGGGRIGRIVSGVLHDEGRVRLAQQYRKKRYYGQDLSQYVARHPGRALQRLARPSLVLAPKLLVSRPGPAVGLVVLKAVEAAGMAVGALRTRRAA